MQRLWARIGFVLLSRQVTKRAPIGFWDTKSASFPKILEFAPQILYALPVRNFIEFEKGLLLVAMSHRTTVEIEQCIARLQTGDGEARHELINCACGRLRELSERMMRKFPALQRFEQSDDVLQNSVIRLSRSLEQLTPRSARDFFGLATLEIRRELIDLMRHYYGPLGQGVRNSVLPTNDAHPQWHVAYDAPDTTNEPSKLAVWAEFHREVELLPNEDREMFDLLWYQGLSQADAAALIGVSERTVKRRWQRARLAIHMKLNRMS